MNAKHRKIESALQPTLFELEKPPEPAVQSNIEPNGLSLYQAFWLARLLSQQVVGKVRCNKDWLDKKLTDALRQLNVPLALTDRRLCQGHGK